MFAPIVRSRTAGASAGRISAGTASGVRQSPTHSRGARPPLLRQRGEKLERWNEHLYDRGGMRRVHLRGRDNILKRLVVHAGAANLGLLMRKLFGKGTPRGLAGAFSAMISAVEASTRPWSVPTMLIGKIGDSLTWVGSAQLLSAAV